MRKDLIIDKQNKKLQKKIWSFTISCHRCRRRLRLHSLPLLLRRHHSPTPPQSDLVSQLTYIQTKILDFELARWQILFPPQ